MTRKTTLSTDETSKLGKTVGAFALTDEDGRNYVAGLRDMTSKSAKHTEEAFEDILADVNARLANKPDYNSSNMDARTKLLLTIKATMSDQASCEKLFNKNLEKLINDAAAIYDQLDEGETRIIVKLLNLYCSLHTLVHAAETVVSATISAENGHFDGNPPIHNPNFRNANESGVARLIRTTCTAFARGGSEKNGVYGKFLTFIQPVLREQFNCRSLPLTPYHGARFSVLFHNASVIYALREHITKFLETHANNGLTKSVQHDLKYYLGFVKGIACFLKEVAKPFWAVNEDKAVDVISLGQHYRDMIAFLEDAAQKPEILLEGRSSFPEKYLRKDAWWDAVFEPNDVHDPIAIECLGVILPALVIFFKNHLKEFLPGGEMMKLTIDQALGLPKTNKFCESIFGFFDRHLRTNPARSTFKIEAFTMWVFNLTGAWMEAKDDEERARIIAQTRKDAPSMKSTYKARQEKILLARRENLQRLQAEKEQQQRKKAAAVLKLCVDLNTLGGLWESDIDIDEGIKKLPNSKKSTVLDAIKTQLQYRRQVLEQKLTNAKLWNFSEGRIQFNPLQMINRLKEVIRQPLSSPRP